MEVGHGDFPWPADSSPHRSGKAMDLPTVGYNQRVSDLSVATGHGSRFRRGTSADPKDGGVSWSLEWVLSMIFIFFLCVFYTVKKGYWSDMGKNPTCIPNCFGDIVTLGPTSTEPTTEILPWYWKMAQPPRQTRQVIASTYLRPCGVVRVLAINGGRSPTQIFRFGVSKSWIAVGLLWWANHRSSSQPRHRVPFFGGTLCKWNDAMFQMNRDMASQKDAALPQDGTM